MEGVGNITLVYARDPEGNIIEIQKWEQKLNTAESELIKYTQIMEIK